PFSVWQHRWRIEPSWIDDILTCLRGEPAHRAAYRIIALPWYNSSNGFYPLSFSPDHPALILDLRGIPFCEQTLRNINIPFTLLDGADFYKADLQNANLSFVRALHTNFHQANLSSANLTAARLEYANFSQAILQNTVLTRAKLDFADLGGADLRDAKLNQANLFSTFMEQVEADRSDFTAAHLDQANLSSARGFKVKFDEAKIMRAELVEAKFFNSSFKGACFDHSDLSQCHLEKSNLTKAQLKHADLTRANISNSECIGVNFSDATLLSATLAGSDLTHSNFERAQLNSADLQDTTLRRTVFRGADLTSASLLRAQLRGTDFRAADLTDCLLRSPHSSAVLDSETKFGWSAESNEPDRDWIVPPVKQLKRAQRERVDTRHAASMTGQVKSLYRENGLHRQASQYYAQERYWQTRTLLRERRYFKYALNFLFAEVLTGYGEKPGRLFGFGVGLVFLAGLAFLLSGITIGDQLVQLDVSDGFSDPVTILQQLGHCMLCAVQCFLPLGWYSAGPAGLLSTLIATGVSAAGYVFAIILIATYVKRGVRE
ncbi:pentapeptide repeat-containing protein, partial [bacterium]|nr:pentapeptide repeat-containing protein [bacterium]